MNMRPKCIETRLSASVTYKIFPGVKAPEPHQKGSGRVREGGERREEQGKQRKGKVGEGWMPAQSVFVKKSCSGDYWFLRNFKFWIKFIKSFNSSKTEEKVIAERRVHGNFHNLPYILFQFTDCPQVSNVAEQSKLARRKAQSSHAVLTWHY